MFWPLFHIFVYLASFSPLCILGLSLISCMFSLSIMSASAWPLYYLSKLASLSSFRLLGLSFISLFTNPLCKVDTKCHNLFGDWLWVGVKIRVRVRVRDPNTNPNLNPNHIPYPTPNPILHPNPNLNPNPKPITK